MFSQFSSKSLFSTAQANLDYRLVFVVSCLLSMWLITIDPLINRDAIIYLRTADAYLQDGILASQSLFDRPFLSILFALIHKFTGIPLVYAGQMVVTVFYGLLATGFVATVRTLGGDLRVQMLAAVLIISHPVLNDWRANIFRDSAYWALSLLAFRELLLFARSPALRHQIAWFAYIGLACLFRFEGLFFVILAPFSMLFTGEKARRGRNCLRLMILPLTTLAGLLGFLLIYRSYLYSGEPLFQDISAYVNTLITAWTKFGVRVDASAQSLLEFTSREDATIAAIGGLAAILVVSICRAIMWPYVAVLAWGAANRLFDRIAPRDRVLINSHLLICLIYLALFLFTKRFMLERYSGIFTLYMLLYLSFILNTLWARGKNHLGKALVILLLLGMSLDSTFNSEYKKAFIGDAIEWVTVNTPRMSRWSPTTLSSAISAGGK